jgi:predicted metal-dependent hydrolase
MAHPHAEATYRIIPFKDDMFAVEVLVPDTQPATVSAFASRSAAEAWIADHQRRVQSQTQVRRGFRGSAYRTR